MTRGNARELAVHLIYGRAFTGEEPEQVISTRMEKEYYEKLGQENDVYADRPSRAQLRYIDGRVGCAAAHMHLCASDRGKLTRLRQRVYRGNDYVGCHASGA